MREEGSESYWVREDVDFEVGLYDGHFDVERCNFVCQALLNVREFIRLGKQATELWSSWVHGTHTSQNPSRAQPEAQYTPRPGVPRWPAGRGYQRRNLRLYILLRRTDAGENDNVSRYLFPHCG